MDSISRQDFLIVMGEWLFFYIPAALMAIWPVRGRMRMPARKVLPVFFAVLTALCVAGALLELLDFAPASAIADPPLLLLLFVLYFWLVKLETVKLVYLLFSDAAVLSFGGMMNLILSSVLNPQNTIYSESEPAGLLLQTGFYACYVLFFFAIRSRQLTWILENYNEKKVWRVVWVVPALVCVCNLLMSPQYPGVMNQGRVAEVGAYAVGVLFVLFLCFQQMFYAIVKTLVNWYDAERKAQMLSNQAGQYVRLKKHMDESRRLRHDFRHVIFAVREMAQEENLEGLKDYLAQYAREYEMATADFSFCANGSVNALVSWYMRYAAEEGTPLEMKLDIPEDSGIADTDLCIVFGNILENALEASRKLPVPERGIRLRADRSESGELYLVMVNHYDGNAKFAGDVVRSTKPDGGIGLPSVRLVAEKYGGLADFRGEGKLFYTNIMIPLSGSQSPRSADR